MLAKPSRNSKDLALSLVGLSDDLGRRMCTHARPCISVPKHSNSSTNQG